MKDDNDRLRDGTLPSDPIADAEPIDGSGEPWADPLPLGPSAKVPAFPVDVYPAWLQDWVVALAEALQCPVDLPAMLALAVLSLSCAKKFNVLVRDDWDEPINVYVAVALKPGESKSPAFAAAMRPVGRFVAEEQKRLEPQIRAAAARYDVAAKRVENLKVQAAKAIDADKYAKLLKELDEAVWEQAALVVPAQLRLVLDDVTAESLEVVLRQQGGRIAIMSDEGGPFELMGGRYSEGVPNIDIYLKGHSGSAISTDRISRAGGSVQCPAMTIGLAIQPDVISGLQAKKGFRGRGLLARFLWCVPTSRVGHRHPDPHPVPAGVRAAYEEAIGALLRLPAEKDNMGEVRPEMIPLHRKGHALMVDLKRSVEPDLGPSGELESVADWGNKLGGTSLRLAGLLYLADHAGHLVDGQIGEGEMRRALRLADYLNAHAQIAFDMMSSDPVARDARYILAWIQRTRAMSFTTHELYQAARARFKAPAEMDPPLDLLVDHLLIRRRAAPPRSGRGRPPSAGFEVNPGIHTQNSRKSRWRTEGGNFVNFVNGPEDPEIETPPVADSAGASQEVIDHV
ncbi:MAG: DnaB domain-containing protein helicase domain-containing protein [bacterium]|nr:MAG: DnaB domain-containing protein helicase domain-containing protein [bacterium]